MYQQKEKLNDDVISRFWLINQQNPLMILNNSNSDLKLKAIAKICMTNVMKTCLSLFKIKYPNYHDELPFLLQNLKEKSTGKKKKKRVSNNINNLSLLKPKHLTETPFINNKETAINNKKTNVPKKRGFLIETLPESSDNKCLPKNNGFVIENSKKPLRSNGKFLLKNKGFSVESSKESLKTNDDKESFKLMTKINKSVEKDKKEKCEKMNSSIADSSLFVNSAETRIKNEKTQHISSKQNEKKVNERRVADPFFITADNSEYMTVITNDKQIDALNKSSDDFKEQSFNSNVFKNRKKSSGSFSQNIQFMKKFSNESSTNNSRGNNLRNLQKSKISNGKEKSSNRQERRLQKFNSGNVTEDKLHPSWEAKKKLNTGAIDKFCGKKTVFDDV